MRLLAAVISFTLIFANFTACESMIGVKNEQIEEEDAVFKYLSNTYYKLTVDKKLTMAFMGGSVTDGYGSTDQTSKSWVYHLTQWFRDSFPDAKVGGLKMSIGGTGSYLADFRYEREVKVKSPDLLFIEYAVNDLYYGRTYEETVRTAESLVQKAYADNPYMDIVFVLVSDKERGKDAYDTLRAHRDVAEKYGLMCITMTDYIYPMLKKTGDDYFKYFTDGVHPNDAGYEFYSSVLIDKIKADILSGDTTVEPPTELKAVTLPEETLTKNSIMLDATMVYTNKIDLTNSNGWEYQANTGFSWLGTRYRGRLYASEIGSKFEFEFEGTDLGLLFGAGPEAGVLSCTVDDREPVLINAYRASKNPSEGIIAWDIPDGKHKVVFELVGKGDSGKNTFEIGAILIS